MPRTEQPPIVLIGINLVINCTFCAYKQKHEEVKDSDVFFPSSCPNFKLREVNYCREQDHWTHWSVCAYNYFNNRHSCCSSCSIGEGMVQISNALNIKVREKQDLKM